MAKNVAEFMQFESTATASSQATPSPTPPPKRVHLYKEDVLEAREGVEEVVLALPEDLPQVFIVHRPVETPLDTCLSSLRCGFGRWFTFPSAAMRSQISAEVL